MNEGKINLFPELFADQERLILQTGELSAATFRYPSGVCALRIKNTRGELVILPFQGQQIWSASFCGQDLTMKTAFTQPMPTQDYLKTYGGFMLHCGATAMGVPSAEDRHPLHGELPNLPYQQAYIRCGADGQGRYLVVGGQAEYLVGFTVHYRAEPEIRLDETATTAGITLKITNLRTRPMEFMYLCHINFRPIDGSRLVYSAKADQAHIKVHRDIPSDRSQAEQEALRAYMDKIAEHPEHHHLIDAASQIYDPEIVMTIHYQADRQGTAHCMQVLPDGSAFYAAFRPDQLPVGLRWISRTGSEDALGMLLPATGEHKGLAQARKKGQTQAIPPGGSVTLNLKAGYLEAAEAGRIAGIIRETIS
jgi:hypothetical protein